MLELAKAKLRRDKHEQFEVKPTLLEQFKRSQNSKYNGNFVASYVSAQANMLHKIAQSEHAPSITIIASQFDHAFSPLKVIQSLVNLDDIQGFFVTNMRHGLAGKQLRLDQLVSVLTQDIHAADSFVDRLHFFQGVTKDYRKKLLDEVKKRL